MSQEFFEPLEPDADADADESRHRCTDAALSDREAAALELLAAGSGTALAAQVLAERFGVSLRQARRYVQVAALELFEPLTPFALDQQAAADLFRLGMIAGRAAVAGDDALAIKATAAHARALTQFRRATDPVPLRRLRLRTARTRPEIIG